MLCMSYLFVNFEGPRHLDEIAPFLITLLTDRDVIQARLPDRFHDWLFRRIAKKRAKRIRIVGASLSPSEVSVATLSVVAEARIANASIAR